MGGDIKFRVAVDGIDKEILKTRSLSQAMRDLDKVASTLGRSTQTVFGNASSGNSNKLGLFQGRPGFKELNPDLFKQLGKDAGKSYGKSFNDARFEAMQDLSRRAITRGSQSMIDMQAAVAMSDYKLNNQKPFRNQSLQSFINQSLGVGAGQNTPNKAGYANFWKQAIPPFIPPASPQPPRVPMWKNLLAAGIATANGNQYLGARSAMAAFGIGGGGGGGLGGHGIGAAGGSFLPAAVALTAVKVAAEGVKIAFEQMKEAIQKGFKLYTDAAKLGISPGRLSRAQNVGSMIGMDESEIQALMLQGEFGGRRRGTGLKSSTSRGGVADVAGELFGARGANQMGQLQQAVNMRKELLKAEYDLMEANMAEAMTARTLYEEGYNLKELFIDFKAVFADLAAILGPFIKVTLGVADLAIKQTLSQLNAVYWALNKIDPSAFPMGRDANHKSLAGQRIPVSQFEKMGFNYGGGGFSDPAKQIAANTAKMVQQLGIIITGAYKGIPDTANYMMP